MCMYKFYICERIVAFKKKKFPPASTLPPFTFLSCNLLYGWQSIVKHKLKLVCRVFQFTPRLLLPMQQNTTTPSKNNQTTAWLFKRQMATNSY